MRRWQKGPWAVGKHMGTIIADVGRRGQRGRREVVGVVEEVNSHRLAPFERNKIVSRKKFIYSRKCRGRSFCILPRLVESSLFENTLNYNGFGLV